MLPVGGIIAAAWSRDRIEHLAHRDPEALHTAILMGELSHAHLAHAAEVIGRRPSVRSLTILRSLALHESPLVREGAVGGIAIIVLGLRRAADEAAAQLREIASEDPSPGVRDVAREAASDVDAGVRT